jgi:ankyrin repeat protein
MKEGLIFQDDLPCCRQVSLAVLCICCVVFNNLIPAKAKTSSPHLQSKLIPIQQSTAKSDRAGIKLSLTQAMWTALAFEDPDQLANLLKSGADPNAPEEISLMTPLMVSERAEIAKLLLDAGADPNSMDKLGRTVAHHAVKMEEAASIVRMLGEAGANIDVRAVELANMTPLLYAVEYYVESQIREETSLVIRILAHLGADLEAVDSAGRSALVIAAAHNQPRLIRLLIDLGADPRRATAEGKTPLDYAREANAQEAIQALASISSSSPKAN